jgi:tRNA pseudouridine55 synthase
MPHQGFSRRSETKHFKGDRIPPVIRDFDFEAGEILAVDKPSGMTSFAVVKQIRHWSRCRKVGHAGTLDPLATGLLIVCTGKDTRRVSEFVAFDKTYDAVVELGRSTDTDDAEGIVIENHDVPDWTAEQVFPVLNEFTGEIEQIPPMFSAIKQNGKRLYKLARRGIEVERKARQVRIFDISRTEWNRPNLSFRVRCSKGTYIRALARDIGRRLGTGGFLSALRRVEIGPFRVDDAYTLNDLKTLIA